MASELDSNLIEMLMGFVCFKGYSHDLDFYRSVVHTLYGREIDTKVANSMTWFALEETARAFCED